VLRTGPVRRSSEGELIEPLEEPPFVWLNVSIDKPSKRLGQQESVDALLTSFQPAEWMAATATRVRPTEPMNADVCVLFRYAV